MKDDSFKGPESARLEHCRCGSTVVRNNVYLEKGKRMKVYVECARCGGFVTRYTLLRYTSDEPYESLLRKLRFTRLNSGKRTLRLVETLGGDIEEEYTHVLELIRTSEDTRRMEEIMEDDYPESLE